MSKRLPLGPRPEPGTLEFADWAAHHDPECVCAQALRTSPNPDGCPCLWEAQKEYDREHPPGSFQTEP